MGSEHVDAMRLVCKPEIGRGCQRAAAYFFKSFIAEHADEIHERLVEISERTPEINRISLILNDEGEEAMINFINDYAHHFAERVATDISKIVDVNQLFINDKHEWLNDTQ